jgi:hypothetical protein
MVKNTESAFKWIVGLLTRNNIPFQISGGLAAKHYGANRPLYDIDIDIKGNNFDKLLPFAKNYILYGPKRYLDDSFDLQLLTLEYQGQRIDLGASENSKIYNSKTKQWQECETNFDLFQEFEIYGLKVPVITWQALVKYKEIIRRPTDLEDVAAITKNFS